MYDPPRAAFSWLWLNPRVHPTLVVLYFTKIVSQHERTSFPHIHVHGTRLNAQIECPVRKSASEVPFMGHLARHGPLFTYERTLDSCGSPQNRLHNCGEIRDMFSTAFTRSLSTFRQTSTRGTVCRYCRQQRRYTEVIHGKRWDDERHLGQCHSQIDIFRCSSWIKGSKHHGTAQTHGLTTSV